MSRWRSTLYDKVLEINGVKYIQIESGRNIFFHGALHEAETGINKVARWLARANKLADSPDELERYEWFVDDLEGLVNIHRKELEKRFGKRKAEDRIAALRITEGRTPEEVALFTAKADELERRLAAK